MRVGAGGILLNGRTRNECQDDVITNEAELELGIEIDRRAGEVITTFRQRIGDTQCQIYIVIATVVGSLPVARGHHLEGSTQGINRKGKQRVCEGKFESLLGFPVEELAIQVEMFVRQRGYVGRILLLRGSIVGPGTTHLIPSVGQGEHILAIGRQGNIGRLIPLETPVTFGGRTIHTAENHLRITIGDCSGIDIRLTSYEGHKIRPLRLFIFETVHSELGIRLRPVRVGHEVQGSVGPNHHAHYKHEAQRYNLSHM